MYINEITDKSLQKQLCMSVTCDAWISRQRIQTEQPRATRKPYVADTQGVHGHWLRHSQVIDACTPTDVLEHGNAECEVSEYGVRIEDLQVSVNLFFINKNLIFIFLFLIVLAAKTTSGSFPKINGTRSQMQS